MLYSLKKLVVFDLDGTLNQIHFFSVPAHQQAMKEMNIEIKSGELIKSTFGQKSNETVKILAPNLDEAGQIHYYKRVSVLESENIVKHGRPYAGVPEMLKCLINAGYILAVCSNASIRYITMVIDTLDIHKYITYIQPKFVDHTKVYALGRFLDDVKPERAVMVGDRIYDFEAARGNNIPFIGCLYGYCPAEMVGADVTVKSAEELFDAVEELIGE
jgi:phosphoglycolate phosphatase